MSLVGDGGTELTLAAVIREVAPYLQFSESLLRADAVIATGVTFAEHGLANPDLANQLVLLPGVAPSELSELIPVAAKRKAAALVVRGPFQDDRGSLERALPCVLTLDEAADWGTLFALLQSLFTPVGQEYATSAGTGDLFDAANALAARAGGAVCFVDPFGKVLGFSTLNDQPLDATRRRTTLFLHEAVPVTQDADHSIVTKSHRSVVLAASGDGFGRVARAVRDRTELLGTIWVVLEDPARARPIAELLDGTEPIISRQFRKARDEADLADARRRRQLNELLSPSLAPSFFAQHSIAASAEHYVVTFGVQHRADQAAPTAIRRLLNIALSNTSTWFAHAFTSTLEDRVVVVICASDMPRIEGFVECVVASDQSIYAGIGPRAFGPSQLAANWRFADATLSYVLARSTSGAGARYLSFDDCRDSIGLSNIATELRASDFAHNDSYERLVRLDEAGKYDALRTITAYLNNFGEIRAAAMELHVHANTVRYRLERICDEAQLNLTAPDSRLWLDLRLRTSQEAYAGTETAPRSHFAGY